MIKRLIDMPRTLVLVRIKQCADRRFSFQLFFMYNFPLGKLAHRVSKEATFRLHSKGDLDGI